jgi:branched-chain amino acid transport system substrate-binding protein
MKRIVFLIIASLMVLGLVLPGCAPAEENIIKIAVCGPMADIQGQNHLAGAEMARDEINADGGVDIGGTMYDIELVTVDTNEVAGTPAEGVIALDAVINDVDFVIGGFRTEYVLCYREVAMEADKIFMDCGAATDALQFSVVTNYQRYKYWFKATPYNSTFLGKSLLKMTYIVGAILKAALNLPSLTPRVHILVENTAWCEGIVAAAQDYLSAMGFDVTGPTRVDPEARAIPWGDIAPNNPHIILTALSGSVGDVYTNTKAIPALTIGINVHGQSKSHWTGTGGACEGEIMLDTWAEGMNLTANTHDWVNDFVAKTGDYPLYTAGTYDAIYAVTDAMEATNSLDSDTLIAYMETHSYTGVGGTTAYYTWPALGSFDPIPPSLPDTWWALNASQVYALYPGIVKYYGYSNFEEMAANWTAHMTDWTTEGGFLPHDIVYGPGYQTGIGSQWQDGHKMGIWPLQLAPLDTPIATLIAVGLIDQYGNWNFMYEGTVALYLPIGSDQPTGGMLTIPGP